MGAKRGWTAEAEGLLCGGRGGEVLLFDLSELGRRSGEWRGGAELWC